MPVDEEKVNAKRKYLGPPSMALTRRDPNAEPYTHTVDGLVCGN